MKHQDLNIIRNIYLFDGLSDNDKESAIALLNLQIAEHSSGDILVSPDDFCPRLLVVLSGTLFVLRGAEGKEVLLNTLKVGDTFGAASMFGKCDAYPTFVKTKGDVRIAYTEESSLIALFSRFPTTAISHIRYLSDRIRFLNEKISKLTGRNAESKLSNYILDAYGKGTLHHINMSRLASSLDMGRASLYRLIQKLCDQGVISFEGGTITILQYEQLERLAKS
jgi:CRP-like cAMP-binding protein